jgi:hypothetical protein
VQDVDIRNHTGKKWIALPAGIKAAIEDSNVMPSASPGRGVGKNTGEL